MKKRVLSLLLVACMLLSTVAYAATANVGDRQQFDETVTAHEVSLDQTERSAVATGTLALQPAYNEETPAFTVGAKEKPDWIPDVEYVDAGAVNGSAAYSDETYTVTTGEGDEAVTNTVSKYTLVQLSDYFKGASQIIVPSYDWGTLANAGYTDRGSSEGWHRRYIFDDGYEWYMGTAKSGNTYDYEGDNVYFKFTPDAAGTLYVLTDKAASGVYDGFEAISATAPSSYNINTADDDSAPTDVKYFAVLKYQKNATATASRSALSKVYAKSFTADEEIVVPTPHVAGNPPVYLIVWDDRDTYKEWYEDVPYKVYDLKAANGVVAQKSTNDTWVKNHGYLDKITSKPDWGTFGIIDGICDSGDFINGCRYANEATFGTLNDASQFLKQSTTILSQGSSVDAIGSYTVNDTKDQSIYYVQKTTTDGKTYFTRIKDDGTSYYTAADVTEGSGVMKATTESEAELNNGNFTTSMFYPYYNDDEYNRLKASNTDATKCFDDDYTWYSFKMTSPATVYVGRGGAGKDMTWQRALDQGWKVAEGVTFGDNAKTYYKHYNAGETVKIPTLGYMYGYGVKSGGYDQSDMLIVWDDYRNADAKLLKWMDKATMSENSIADFDADKYEYTVTVPEGVSLSDIGVEVEFEAPETDGLIEDVSTTSTEMVVKVTGTAKNGVDKKVYTITFKKPITPGITDDSARPRAIIYEDTSVAYESKQWTNVYDYSTENDKTEFTIKVQANVDTVRLAIVGQPVANTGTGTNTGLEYTYYTQNQKAEWYDADFNSRQCTATSGDESHRKDVLSAEYKIGETAYVVVSSADDKYSNTYKINIRRYDASKAEWVKDLTVNSERPTTNKIKVNPSAVDVNTEMYTDRSNFKYAYVGDMFRGLTQIMLPLQDAPTRVSDTAAKANISAFMGGTSEYFSFVPEKNGKIYVVFPFNEGTNTASNFSGWTKHSLVSNQSYQENKEGATYSNHFDDVKGIPYSLGGFQWATDATTTTLTNSETSTEDKNVKTWEIWPYRFDNQMLGALGAKYPDGTTATNYQHGFNYVYEKYFTANEKVSVPVWGNNSSIGTNYSVFIKWEDGSADKVEQLATVGGVVLDEVLVDGTDATTDPGTYWYSDRNTPGAPCEANNAASDYFIGATVIRRAKGDAGQYVYTKESDKANTIRAYFSNDYDGKGDNPYWLSFKVTSDCTVFTTAAYNGTWYNAPSDWTHVTNASIYLRATNNLYFKHYSAGETVKIPNYGWTTADDPNYDALVWDPQVYAIVWDSSEKVNPIAPAQVKLEVSAVSGGTVKVDGEDIGSTLSKNYDENTTLELEAVAAGGYSFAYWLDENSGRVVSEEATYSVTLATPKKLSAVFANDGEEVKSVTFKNKNNQIVYKADVAAEGAATVPADPYYMGYVFQGWKLDGVPTAIKAGDELAFDALGEGNNVYVAYYAKNTAMNTLNLVNGTAEPAAEDNKYEYDTKITVTAPAESGTMSFSHWIKDGQTVSYETEYSFYMGAADTTVKAEYAAAAPKKEPVLIMTDPVVLNGDNRIAFFAERHLYADETNGRELIEMGILVDPTGEKTDYGFDTGVLKATSTSKLADGQFTVRKASLTEGQKVSARAYMIYREGATVRTIFSNIVEATYTAE